MIQNTGYVVQNVPDLPIELLKAIGGSWVSMVQTDAMSQADVDALVKHYLAIGGGILVTGSMAATRSAARYGVNVLPVPKNEPNLKMLDSGPNPHYMHPEELGTIVRQLCREGIKLGAPNVNSILDIAYQSKFYAELGGEPIVGVVHGYDVPLAKLPRGLIYSELKPRAPLVDGALEIIRIGLTAAIYQAVDTGVGDGFITNDNYTGPWRLNAAGELLAKRLTTTTFAQTGGTGISLGSPNPPPTTNPLA